jgi:hypothetical protein
MSIENEADDAATLEAEQTEAAMAEEIASEEAEETFEEDGEDAESEVEIEHDGQVYRVPVALKDSFLRNADYTQKTQALSQERRALETRDATARQHIREYAQLIALNDQIQAYDAVDWDALQKSDADAAQREWRNLTLLKEKRAGVVEQFQRKEQARALDQQRQRARLIEEGHAVLARELPDWSPDLAGKIVTFGANKYGFSADEIAGIADPRMVRVLHDAMCGHHAGDLRSKVEQIEAAQKTRPAAQLRPGASTTPKDPSKMTIAQYHAWRNG